jgi:Arc/MetJ-type ribon-helix-helix transcriptional regulator
MISIAVHDPDFRAARRKRRQAFSADAVEGAVDVLVPAPCLSPAGSERPVDGVKTTGFRRVTTSSARFRRRRRVRRRRAKKQPACRPPTGRKRTWGADCSTAPEQGNLHGMMSHPTHMPKTKVALTLDAELVERVDELVARRRFRNRSQAIESALADKLQRLARTRLAQESARLNSREEKRLAEKGLTEDLLSWPES